MYLKSIYRTSWYQENKRYCYIYVVKTIYEDTKWVSTMKVGCFGLDTGPSHEFFGYPKIKKFVNISIKVCEDEIFNTSVWYH